MRYHRFTIEVEGLSKANGNGMNLLDWAIGAAALLCLLRGVLRGAVSQVFGIAAVLGGFFLGLRWQEPIGLRLMESFPGLPKPTLIAFLVVFGLSWFIIGFAGHYVGSLLHKGGLGWLDRFLGAVVGIAKALVLAVVLLTLLTFFLSPEAPLLRNSRLAPYVQFLAQMAVRAAPEEVRQEFDRKREVIQRYWSNGREAARCIQGKTSALVALRHSGTAAGIGGNGTAFEESGKSSIV